MWNFPKTGRSDPALESLSLSLLFCKIWKWGHWDFELRELLALSPCHQTLRDLPAKFHLSQRPPGFHITSVLREARDSRALSSAYWLFVITVPQSVGQKCSWSQPLPWLRHHRACRTKKLHVRRSPAERFSLCKKKVLPFMSNWPYRLFDLFVSHTYPNFSDLLQIWDIYILFGFFVVVVAWNWGYHSPYRNSNNLSQGCHCHAGRWGLNRKQCGWVLVALMRDAALAWQMVGGLLLRKVQKFSLSNWPKGKKNFGPA